LAKKIEPSIQAQYEGQNVVIKGVRELREWTLNGQRLFDDISVKQSEIEIKNVQMHHSGKYEGLVAEGAYTYTRETSYLYVGG